MKLTQARFVLADTETTDQSAPKVVELAGLQWCFSNPIQPSDLKETLINPQCKIDPSSMSIHHITNADVSDSPILADVLPEWNEWIGDAVVVAYNSDYDKGVLADTGLDTKVWLDAYRMSMHCWSLGMENEDGFKLSSFKQQELRYWLDLPPTMGDAHRAGADVQVTAYLLERVIKIYLDMGCADDLECFKSWVNGPICHMVLPLGGRPYSGKTPEQVEDWALKKAFDPKFDLFSTFEKFNLHDCMRPELIRRFGEPVTPMRTPQLKLKQR